MGSRSLVVLASALLLSPRAPRAADSSPAPPLQQKGAAAKLRQGEEKARVAASLELVSLAKSCISLNAIDEAHSLCLVAAAIAPADDGWRALIGKLAQKKNHPTKDDLAKLAERKKAAIAKGVEILTPVVAAYDAADLSDDLARVVALMKSQAMPVDALVKKFDLVWYQPYCDWRRKKDVERFAAGSEIVDDAWCDKAKVAQLDAEHTSWPRRWQIADEAHQVETTLPVHTARTVLMIAGSYRRFVLGYLGGEIDLRPARPKLPIILTATRAELEARMHDYQGSEKMPREAAAFYLAGSGVGNPCFVTFELLERSTGKSYNVDLAGLRHALLHEETHQILFEYLKHATDPRAQPTVDPWVQEGVAEFLPNFVSVEGTWTLAYPRTYAAFQGDSFVAAGFGWCHDHVNELKPAADFITYDDARMSSGEAYLQAHGFVAYLFEGKERAYRAGICKLVELSHEAKAKSDSFAACFPGVDLNALDAEFRAWCKELKITDK
jgi:hypothetical protein